MASLPILSEQYPPTTQKAIASFENELGVRVPVKYREFLLRSNGGRPNRDHYLIMGLKDNPYGLLDRFFGLGAPIETSDLLRANRFYAELLPRGVIGIAKAASNDIVVMDLRNSTEGQIRYLDYAHLWSTGEWREQDLYHIADSFEEFLGLLRKA